MDGMTRTEIIDLASPWGVGDGSTHMWFEPAVPED
jgi:hypothetical protein